MTEDLNPSIVPRLNPKLLPAATIIKNFVDGEPDCNYEIYLLELLNNSTHFLKKGGSCFSAPSDESHGQCDAISKDYDIDFKLLSSSTRLQASNLFSYGISNLGNGITAITESKKKTGEIKATQIHVAFQTKDVAELIQLKEDFQNSRKHGIEKDIINVLNTLEKKKNIMLFFPYTCELEGYLETENLDDIIVSELNYYFNSLFAYRSLKMKEFDTYFVTIFQKRFYIFSIQDDTLNLVEKIDCVLLPTFIKLKKYHL
ncbi:TPA: hypothetical protein TUL06_002144 [Streptococcus equi subsp. zooepidemicus]|uniref:hypothetical protein n=1 Tax=Streptococcus equi TaxID=1336 RepID=UPI0012AEEE2D|nr:hypothetical protein [Streptococcus equi]MCD3400957.1 hypothetical protein [Streptococcus equi subsp. zooepidemicus]MCD3413484.1 hypothetical protein [Streptococcus equi subsp. zooepidemicus]MCD3430960.1 hypothetical protein [Streptococcus equi subsp. zooepidemicus]QGM23541.1 hypothetical protein GJS33_05120 [Streptococcus equi subsp. zooepidemicus]HEL0009365.1 hypothetical protein [Streptococcus equi subsp. zooepidemicus]